MSDDEHLVEAWRSWVGGAPGMSVDPLPANAPPADHDADGEDAGDDGSHHWWSRHDKPDDRHHDEHHDQADDSPSANEIYTDMIVDNTTAAGNLMMMNGAMQAYGDAGLAAADAVSFNSAAYD